MSQLRNLWKIPTLDYDNLFEEYGTKSAVMRYLISEGYSDREIANYLNVRVQFVNNVRRNSSSEEEREEEWKRQYEEYRKGKSAKSRK